MRIGNMKRQLGGYVLEAQSAWRGLGSTGTAAEKRFVLFGRGRSGSTLLVQMLDSNPAIGCLDEILRFRTFMPVRMVDRELSRLDKSIRGFKLLSYQVRTLHGRHDRQLRDWMAQPDVCIFHLKRENILRHALSNVYADARHAYHSTDSSAARAMKITVTPETLFRWMCGSLELLEWEERYLGDLDRDEIVYERDLATPEAQAETLTRVSATLGVMSVPTEAPQRMVTPRDYGAFVANWSELHDAIRASEFSAYLDRSD